MMRLIRSVLQMLRIVPSETLHPTADERLRTIIEKRTRELEMRLYLNDLALRNLQRRE